MRVTQRESKREEKRTGSGSIRRVSERDEVIEGDRGNGEAAALLRLEGEGMGTQETREGSWGTRVRERRENWRREKDEERQSHRAFPGPSIGNLTNVRTYIWKCTKILEINVFSDGTEREVSKETQNMRQEGKHRSRENAGQKKPNEKSEFSDHVGTAQRRPELDRPIPRGSYLC